MVGANPANQMPPSANMPLPGQSKPLSTWRQNSNIPTGGAPGALPPHQPTPAAAASTSGSSSEVGSGGELLRGGGGVCLILQDPSYAVYIGIANLPTTSLLLPAAACVGLPL